MNENTNEIELSMKELIDLVPALRLLANETFKVELSFQLGAFLNRVENNIKAYMKNRESIESNKLQEYDNDSLEKKYIFTIPKMSIADFDKDTKIRPAIFSDLSFMVKQ